jgi:hypothetical protein
VIAKGPLFVEYSIDCLPYMPAQMFLNIGEIFIGGECLDEKVFTEETLLCRRMLDVLFRTLAALIQDDGANIQWYGILNHLPLSLRIRTV